MTGTHHIEVKNRDAVFKFDLHRNITIIRGDSGTGKTTLYEMIADYTRLQQASGVNLSCDKNSNMFLNSPSLTARAILFLINSVFVFRREKIGQFSAGKINILCDLPEPEITCVLIVVEQSPGGNAKIFRQHRVGHIGYHLIVPYPRPDYFDDHVFSL